MEMFIIVLNVLHGTINVNKINNIIFIFGSTLREKKGSFKYFSFKCFMENKKISSVALCNLYLFYISKYFCAILNCITFSL